MSIPARVCVTDFRHRLVAVVDTFVRSEIGMFIRVVDYRRRGDNVDGGRRPVEASADCLRRVSVLFHVSSSADEHNYQVKK